MKMIEELKVTTSMRVQFVDITAAIGDIIQKSGVTDGLAIVYSPHTTAGVTINEAADPSVVSDIINKLGELVPKNDRYRHAEGNSDSHIKASLMGSSVSIFVKESKPVLGVWQGVFFCEFDGPRNRKVFVKIITG
ncbi:MAG: secondary thiamine-phosphate synthase enzyme YjbQ [Syntrophaceae bacterium]|nr:secondary thiamine-phosphate synthase enzyme YjbQ [Syntrophaceae bacterium]